MSVLEQTLNWLKEDGHVDLLSKLQHGLEKEGLRVDGNSKLSDTPHPQALGSALTHSHITTDYSESLLEFITPVFEDSKDALDFLADLHRYTYQHLDDETIWPASMPCMLPNEKDIPIARYGSSNIGTMKYVYRVGLEHRYGKTMQTIAGIHYNFSMPDGFWPLYQRYRHHKGPLQDFRSDAYFSLIRNFRRYSWLLMYLFGASPTLCKSFLADKKHNLEPFTQDTLYLPYATSLRMSDLGYSNKAQSSLAICFNHLQTYASTLNKAIHTPYPKYEALGIKTAEGYKQLNANILQIENEYYSDIRPKRVTKSGEKPVQALMARGVEYIEVRNTDINPFLPLGIDQTQADFLDIFLVMCLLTEDREITTEECDHIFENHQRVVTRGREPNLALIKDEEEITLTAWATEIFAEMNQVAQLLDQHLDNHRYQTALDTQFKKLENVELTPSAMVLAAMQKDNLSHNDFVMQQAIKHRQTLMESPLDTQVNERFSAMTFNSLEEQRQIEAADQCDFDTYLSNYLAS